MLSHVGVGSFILFWLILMKTRHFLQCGCVPHPAQILTLTKLGSMSPHTILKSPTGACLHLQTIWLRAGGGGLSRWDGVCCSPLEEPTLILQNIP